MRKADAGAISEEAARSVFWQRSEVLHHSQAAL
jgi:hypothetical protein